MEGRPDHAVAAGCSSHDVALVIANLAAGGAQRVLATLANELDVRSRRVCVITLSSSDDDFYQLSHSVTRIALDQVGRSESTSDAVAATARRIRSLRAAIRTSGANHVVSFIGRVNILTVLATRGLDVRVVISERNDPQRQSLGLPWDLLRRLSYRYADVVTAVHNDAALVLSAYVPTDKIQVVPQPIPPVSNWIDAAEGEREPVIVAVGRLAPQKAHDVLLDAASIALPPHPGWRVVLIGEGAWRERLRNHADALGIGDRVHFLGPVPEVEHHLRTASIFALPSRFEGTSNALLEAMACGLPSIVTDECPGSMAYVEDGVNGFVVPSEDPSALGVALECLMSNRPLRISMGQAARERLASEDPDYFVSRWEELLGLI